MEDEGLFGATQLPTAFVVVALALAVFALLTVLRLLNQGRIISFEIKNIF